MKCDRAMALISEYIDGNLSRKQRESLEQHLDGCSECRELLADFRRIVDEAQDLETLEPPDSGWLEIRKELESRRQKVWTRSVKKKWMLIPAFKPVWALAAALALIVVVGSVVFGPGILNRAPGFGENGQKVAIAKLVEAEKHYQLAIKALGEALIASRNNMNPEILQVFQDNLEVINASLSACKQAVTANPDDMETRQYLLAVYKQKADLMTQMVSYGTETSPQAEKKTKT